MKFDRYLQFIDLLDRLFLVAGIIFLLLGFAGLILIITTYPKGMFKDDTFSMGFAFINGFMATMGIFLILFHDKIIVKPKQTV